ncbi:BspA family leucine-rich repeat surface protein [Bombilactobacillus mellis]|uniref:BspA family leucine-rich repeat surface protein n=1 Tax=Bombilactobacillus mellis TaxID=1218508 RepID=UPI0022481E4C|nr:BspA family leucine-rich repeat surface protein [Bombilactobacillus mellis]MCX0279939.1 BspA family leucine-rich repeat surface protein [Bombilactobacillus mellis]
MKLNNKHRGLVLSSTFVGLVCGLVLTHQQAYAAQTPPVSNQQSQITTVSDNNLSQTAALNPRSYSSNISYPTPVTHNVTPSTYSSPETTATAKQEPANSDLTAAAPIPNTGATVPTWNGTATSTNPENNNSANPATSSPTPDSGNSANTPVAASDNQTNGNSNTTTASSEQPETNILAQGTWGTSKWDYTQEGDDYILHLHAGTLGTPEGIEGIGRLNTAFERQLTQIIIDPGVIANQNSRGLFSFLSNLKTIQGLENLDTSQVTDMSHMFFTCSDLTTLDVSHFNTSKVTDMSYMFTDCQDLPSLDVSYFNTSKVTDMSHMFTYCPSLLNLDVSHFNTSKVTDMSEMFADCRSLRNLDVSDFDTSQVTDMSEMFQGCTNLTSLDVSHFDTSQVTNMFSMFSYSPRLTSLDVSHFNTSKVTDMSSMFDSCSNLPSLNVSHFDTSQVTSMLWMFEDCENLSSLDVSHFNTSKVTNMYGMFEDCGRLTNIDVSGFNTSKVTDMMFMFEGCESLANLDVSHFDTSQVTSMSVMFADCKNLTSLDLSSFDTSQLVNSAGYHFAMLAGCTNLHHLVLGPKIQLIDQNGWISDLPAVPAAGTKIPGTDKIVTAPYWVATSGYQQGKRYTSDELQQLTGRDQVTTYDWDSQVPYQDTVESKSVTRTINVHYPDGQVKTIQDTVDLSRKVKVKADGSKTYGEWSTAQWEAYTVPELAGYQANQSKIPAQTVDSNTTDTTIDILYEPIAQTIVIQYLDQGQVVGTQKLVGYTGETLIPNYHAPQGYEITSSPQPNITVDATGTQIIQVNVSHKITQSAETLTKTRTINIHLPNATVKTYRQVAVIKRNVAVDQVTGSKTYGPWHNNSWDAMDIPIIEGYTANQNSIAAQEVTAETENETIDIFYLQN